MKSEGKEMKRYNLGVQLMQTEEKENWEGIKLSAKQCNEVFKGTDMYMIFKKEITNKETS